MSTKSNGGPAFPAAVSDWIDHPVHGHINRADIGDAAEQGMSLRDWFAGRALSGLLAYGRGPNVPWADHPPSLARNAYEIADAMLAERDK